MTETDPIQYLMDEHDVIISSQEVVKYIDGRWENDAAQYDNTVRKLLDFFRDYSDCFHHRKEEEVLFADMISHLDFQQHEIIAELEEHHDMFRNYVQEIEEALKKQEWQVTQSTLNRYIEHLLDHIAAENDEVYMMAQTLFSETELERMYFRFKDIDMELGEKRKLELVKMLTQLKTQ